MCRDDVSKLAILYYMLVGGEDPGQHCHDQFSSCVGGCFNGDFAR